MTDVVSALSFLGEAPDTGTTSYDDPSPPSDRTATAANELLHDEESVKERQRAVAEAIEWGSTSRRLNASRRGSAASL